MAETATLARFIPFRKTDLVELLIRDSESLDETQVKQLRQLVRLIEALWHHDFHKKLEQLKEAYFPFDPDSDVRSARDYTDAELVEHALVLTRELTLVLNDANYEPISQATIEAALEQDSSVFALSMRINFDEFEQALVYSRGKVEKTQEVRHWFFWTKEVEVLTYERVAMFIRFKGDDHFSAKRRKQLKFSPGSTIVKLFKDIPCDDLEMLFPNTEVLMTTKDKVLIGAPALIGFVPVALKLAPAVAAIGLLIWVALGWADPDAKLFSQLLQLGIGLGILGGYAFKQYTNYKNKRIRFLMALADNLYFKNLDNNAGVFSHLVDAAEEEECKEAILAYTFLLRHGPMTVEQLDERVEQWFATKLDCKLDFEEHDALAKLVEMGIGQETDGLWSVMPLEQALERVDHIWDNLYQFNAV